MGPSPRPSPALRATGPAPRPCLKGYRAQNKFPLAIVWISHFIGHYVLQDSFNVIQMLLKGLETAMPVLFQLEEESCSEPRPVQKWLRVVATEWKTEGV